MNFMDTVKGSLLEGFYPAGWDFERIDACCRLPDPLQRESWWNPGFQPVACGDIHDFDTYMGHEIALQIRRTREEGRKLMLILPVGPMGMYRWAVYFLKEWGTDCRHVTTFNMDEWADSTGKTLSADDPAAFQNAMCKALFDPLGELTVPPAQRNFATKENLPTYPAKMEKLRAEGARLVLVFGIGRMCHIAFWEPHFGAEFASDAEWLQQTYRLGARLHPMTIEQNAITSFKSRTTLVPCFANTIGPKLMFSADWIIGGADGALGRGMQWQGMSFLMTLHYGPTRHVTASYIPTLPGRLYYLNELAGPLTAECN